MIHSRLLELLSYDEGNGEFRWKNSPCPRVPAGSVAGCQEADGYIRIQLDGQRYSAGPLAWFYVHGEWPEVIDHQDRNRANNRIQNLRNVTQQVNLRNTGVSARNKSGYKGVRWIAERGKWRATIMLDNKTKSLGSFVEFRDAVEARRAAEGQYGFAVQPPLD